MSMFGNLTTTGLEKQEDLIGGNSVLETGIYSGKIKVAYAGKSKGGAHSISFVIDLAGKEYRETLYITNKNGENFFLNKQDNSKKVPLPGFSLVDNLCLLTTDKPLCEQLVEDKVIKQYDFEQKKEVPTNVPVLVDLLDKDISLAIIKELVNKQAKNDSTGAYEATSEEREQNVIDKVFHTESKLTVVEANQGETVGTFWDKWSEKNAGKTRDKRSIKGGQDSNGRNGAPPKPTNQTSMEPKKSLFGKKS